MNNDKKEKRGPLQFRDVMDIVDDDTSKKNAEIPNRIDDETGEKIPDGMPLWRWRAGKRRKKIFDEHKKRMAKKDKGS